jgi:hypothetical protein
MLQLQEKHVPVLSTDGVLLLHTFHNQVNEA